MGFERSIDHWRALPFLSTKETATVLGVQPQDVRSLVRDKALEVRDLCGREVVLVSSLVNFVGEKPKESAGPAANSTAALTGIERRIVRDLRKGVA